MKYLLIFLISFAFIHPVYAAKQVQGSVPVVQPLQPPAIGVSANLNHNIQEQNVTQSGEANAPSSAQPTFVDQQNPLNQVGASGSTTAVYKKSSSWVWWPFIILGLILVGFWVKRRLEQP